jgi:hypothetical protein
VLDDFSNNVSPYSYVLGGGGGGMVRAPLVGWEYPPRLRLRVYVPFHPRAPNAEG